MPNVNTLTLSGTGVAGVQIPQIGLGTWPHTGQASTDMVAMAIANGYRHIDTAQKYGNEDAVGKAVRASSVARDELFITTKLINRYFGEVAIVREGIEHSLQETGLDYIDLMLIHWPNPQLGNYVQTCASLAQLVETGLIRAWGVSNFKPAHVQAVADAGLAIPINQIQVDPLSGQPDYVAANAALDVVVGAYSPTGRDVNLSEFPALVQAAERHGKTPHQIVLRWHVQQGRIAVPRSAHAERQRENLDVFDFELSDAEITAINALDNGSRARLDADEYGH
ncbi:aldo/keto reductase [Enteractinococcus helveticum]|uniref:Oxidoreductase n=1 Tax=Enteractinococcus helveticum TaxID=1837282 RepID=A0A1B7LUM0_9MICC|nr:aldo/keto reductase [Enteractinococcus helveticum]OAV51139.1 oxidoreductase [Enteractinococcus helveticum]